MKACSSAGLIPEEDGGLLIIEVKGAVFDTDVDCEVCSEERVGRDDCNG